MLMCTCIYIHRKPTEIFPGDTLTIGLGSLNSQMSQNAPAPIAIRYAIQY